MLMRRADLSGGGGGGGAGTAAGGVGGGLGSCDAGSGAVVGVVVQAADSNSKSATKARAELVTEADTHDVDFGRP